MKSRIDAHAITNMDDIWINLQAKAPDPGRLIRMKVTDTNLFIGFSDKNHNVYAFNFQTGTYFPLDMIVEELQKKQNIEINKSQIVYANLKDALVNSIPGYLRIISEMEAIING